MNIYSFCLTKATDEYIFDILNIYAKRGHDEKINVFRAYFRAFGLPER